MKSLAVIGTPSDHTASGFRVYTIFSGAGAALTSSACTIRLGFAETPPFMFTTYGLGSTAPNTCRVAGVSPPGVFGLHPVGRCVIP